MKVKKNTKGYDGNVKPFWVQDRQTDKQTDRQHVLLREPRQRDW